MAAQEPAGIRVSRRRFLTGAAAGAAVLTAGGASAVVLHERGNSSDTKARPPVAAIAGDGKLSVDSGPNPLDHPDTRLRHLLRRTSFVAAPADVERFRSVPLDQVVDMLLDASGIDDSAAESKVAALSYATDKPADVIGTWVARLVATERPMVERMTLFWHGLLTSGLSKTGAKRAGLMLTQNQFLRDHAFDRFDVLLKGIVRDPAMMLWLDLATSKKGRANENYARELMELFTLGAGNYSEQDVRESARAHTGYSLQGGATFVFRPAQHDDGEKTFLGETGAFDADSIVDTILKQDAAPAHFAGRLFEAFAYPSPAPDVIAPIADVARTTNFDTKQVLRAVLTSEPFYSATAYRAIVKSPAEFTIGAARLLDVQIDARLLAQAMRVMGQTLFDPPNVAGWPGGSTWLGTSTWFARVNAAAQLVNGGAFEEGKTIRAAKAKKQGATRAPNIAAADLSAVFPTLPASADDAIDQAASVMVDGRISAEAQTTLREYLDEGNSFATLARATQEERLRGLVALLLASPEYQLS